MSACMHTFAVLLVASTMNKHLSVYVYYIIYIHVNVCIHMVRVIFFGGQNVVYICT